MLVQPNQLKFSSLKVILKFISSQNVGYNTHEKVTKLLSHVNGYALIDLIEKQNLIWIKKEVEKMWTHIICMSIWICFR